MRYKQKCFQSSVFAVKPQWLLTPWAVLGTRCCAGPGLGSSAMGQVAASAARGRGEPCREEKVLLLSCNCCAEMIFSIPILWQGNPFLQGWEEAAWTTVKGGFQSHKFEVFLLLFKITLKYSVKTKIFCSEFLWLPKLLTNSQCLCCDRGVRNLPGLAAGGMWGRVSLSMLGWFPQLIPAYCELILSVSSLWECRVRLSGCWVSCQPVATLIRFFSAVSWAFQAWI